MSDASQDMDLSGKLLVAMPGMGDPRFGKTVVFLCAHSSEGAMGLIVNKPSPDLQFTDLLDQLNIPSSGASRRIGVHLGGPVEHGRGFVLHSCDESAYSNTTLKVDDYFGMTATLDILEAIAEGRGPRHSLLALGYSGWGPGQLEQEIGDNGWLTCPANPEIVFGDYDAGKWERALSELGINPLALSPSAGHA